MKERDFSTCHDRISDEPASVCKARMASGSHGAAMDASANLGLPAHSIAVKPARTQRQKAKSKPSRFFLPFTFCLLPFALPYTSEKYSGELVIARITNSSCRPRLSDAVERLRPTGSAMRC